MIRIINGSIVKSTEVLSGYDLIIKDNKIEDIVLSTDKRFQDYEIYDAKGGYITPGFIDIHADYIEHMAAPRPSTLMDLDLSLHEAERELLTHGITTMYHSLKIKPIRKQENIRKFVEIINNTHTKKHLIRHRFHARYEVENMDLIDELIDYIQAKKVHLVSFMDHTPGQGQYRDLEIFKETLKGYGKISDEEIEKTIIDSQSSKKLSLEKIKEISELVKKNNITLASHDDDTIEKIDLVHSYGTEISEFPITLDVAKYASEKGMHTMAGAPNVLQGGSHSENLCATKGILEGAINILCSDYYPPSIIHSVFKLHREFNLPLPYVLNLVTLNPAKAVGIDSEYGSIERGKFADLIIIESVGGDFPAVNTAFVNGLIVFNTYYRKNR